MLTNRGTFRKWQFQWWTWGWKRGKVFTQRRHIRHKLTVHRYHRYHLVSTDVPNSLPITSLLSKQSRRSSIVKNLPNLKMNSSIPPDRKVFECSALCEVCCVLCICEVCVLCVLCVLWALCMCEVCVLCVCACACVVFVCACVRVRCVRCVCVCSVCE